MLQISEQQRLNELEKTIQAGLETWFEVGCALAEIRDTRLYKADYSTFEEYCRQRWGMTRQTANRQIKAAQTFNNLLDNKMEPVGSISERQIRPLSGLDPDEQIEAWNEVLEQNPDGDITAAKVEQVASNYKRDNKANREGDIYTPKGYDACQTPPHAIDPLLPYLRQFQAIWEPAQGEGYLVEAFYDAGFYTIGSDILTGQNFFEWLPDEEWDAIVTNPPYSIKYQWLEYCYKLGLPFALLMPVEMLGAKTAQQLFKEFGIEIVLIDKRINFKMPNKGWDGGGAQFPVAWFTWGLGIGTTLTFATLE